MADFSLENQCGARAGVIVAGVDEVGRGALAGPVVAAAVVFRRRRLGPLRALVRDSKLLTVHQRDRVFLELASRTEIGIGRASVEEIDAMNILRASLLAMNRALEGLPSPPDVALIDGNQAPPARCGVRLVPHGDARSLSIAAASIAAKVTRDRIMRELSLDYPGYGWDHNAGYATADHLAALLRLGPTPVHRTTFRHVLASPLVLPPATGE